MIYYRNNILRKFELRDVVSLYVGVLLSKDKPPPFCSPSSLKELHFPSAPRKCFYRMWPFEHRVFRLRGSGSEAWGEKKPKHLFRCAPRSDSSSRLQNGAVNETRIEFKQGRKRGFIRVLFVRTRERTTGTTGTPQQTRILLLLLFFLRCPCLDSTSFALPGV